MLLFLVLCLVFFILMIFHMRNVAMENHVIFHELRYSNYPKELDPMQFFFISDIHRRVIDRSIIEQVREKAEFVIIGGDLAEEGVPLSQIEENIKRLGEIGPIYFIWGNNDYEINRKALLDLFRRYHVMVLENEGIVVHGKNDKKVYLVGIGEITFKKDDLPTAIQKIDQQAFKVVICHNPKLIKRITNKHHISLVLSGHTHGGQIRIFGFSPYPKGKLSHEKNTDLLISNGYGTTKLPMRLGAKPETHLIIISNF